MKQIIFEGSATALVTPFKEDNRTDLKLLGRLIDFQIENKSDALLLCGTTGEASTLTEKEHRQIISYAVSKVKGKVPVIAGTGSNNTEKALYLSLSAEEEGADALLLVTPYYNKTTQAGLIEHYFFIADRVSLPIILYNVPSRTGLNILPETYKILAEHPNIVATKEANGNIESMIKTMNLCGDSLAFYTGNDTLTLPSLSIGALGVISVAGNIIPKKMHDLCDSFKVGRLKEAKNLQRDVFALSEALFCETNPIPIKRALSLMGFDVGKGRLPLCRLSEKGEAAVISALKKEGLI